jgi:hypothetical protein
MEVRRTSKAIMEFLLETAISTGKMRLSISGEDILKNLNERGISCPPELLKICLGYMQGAGYATFGESSGVKITSAGIDFAEGN